uniref:PDZ domain-containing protein n=1 Tax=Amphilophus citrinellus TaxID=61819 RepID=A0A3Q0RTU2_AMPCI
MDSSFLPVSLSEYSKQRTGMQFTVRSANSPSYSLSRRSYVRKQESTGEVAERERYGTHTGTNVTNKDDDTIPGYETRTRSGISVRTNKIIPEIGTDRRENPAFERRGRSEWRSSNLTSRSKSLDFSTGARSPDQCTRADISQLSNKSGGDINKQAGALEGRLTRIEGSVIGRISSLQAYNSAGASNVQDRSQLLASRGNTLPSRLRALSGSSSRCTETTFSLGSRAGQSILERIEKLYGPAGFGQVDDYKRRSSYRALSLDEAGLRIEKEQTRLNSLDQKGENDCSEDSGEYSGLKTTPEMPQRGGAKSEKHGTDETDFFKVSSPEEASKTDMTANSTPTPLLPCDPLQQERTHAEMTSPVSDDEQTPTNSPSYLQPTSPMAQLGNDTPTADRENRNTPLVTYQAKTQDPDSHPHTLATSSHSNLQDLISPDVKTATQKGKKRFLDLNAWIAGLNPDLKVFSDDEDMDDDESTQKDEDSNYDSDSGGSSVTITSNISQSDHKSFSLSLSDLCNFAGADYDSEIDSNDWQSTDRRSASLSSDMSSFSCVSVLPTEELDKLIEEVRNLGDDALQDYDDVQVVVLHKEVGAGLGFSLAGGVDQNKPITVHKVFHTGVAAKQGSIKEGDHVLSINGTALSGSAHWEALRVLRRAKTRDMVVVVLRKGDIIDAPKKREEGNSQGQTQEQYETGESEILDLCFPLPLGHLVCVQLQKNSRDLGFSLEGGEGSSLGNRPLTVQKIFQGGPVDTVCPGDELLEIQGTSVVGMRRLEAWTLIRGLPPGPVEVLLRRSL